MTPAPSHEKGGGWRKSANTIDGLVCFFYKKRQYTALHEYHFSMGVTELQYTWVLA